MSGPADQEEVLQEQDGSTEPASISESGADHVTTEAATPGDDPQSATCDSDAAEDGGDTQASAVTSGGSLDEAAAGSATAADGAGEIAGEPPAKKKKKGPPLPKNAVQVLLEMKPGLEFEYVSVGPPHQPMFTAHVEIDGAVYAGTGRSKKLAKHATCELALQALTPSSVPARDIPPAVPRAGTPPVEEPLKRKRPGLAAADNQKTPLMLLHEKFPGGQYDVYSEEGLPNNKTFVMSLSIEGQQFFGSGRSKKLAKQQAASLALQMLLDGYQAPLQPGKGPAGLAAE